MIRLITLIFVHALLIACNGIPPYDGAAYEDTARSAHEFNVFDHNVNDQNIHGVHTGKLSNAAILFIHGAPGDWRAYGPYLGDKDLNAQAFMIGVDRPGYGGSGAGMPVLGLHDQAELIINAALQKHNGPFLLVGHSYGGPVQIQIALDFPEHVSGIVMLAGAIDPITQKSRWYHHLAGTFMGQWILPKALDVTTQEMLSLPAELHKQQARLTEVNHPITLIQGEKDWLVPLENAAYAQRHLTNADLEVMILPKQGHFIPWEQYDLVKAKILNHLKNAL